MPIAPRITELAEGNFGAGVTATHTYAAGVVADVLERKDGLVYSAKFATLIYLLRWLPASIFVSHLCF